MVPSDSPVPTPPVPPAGLRIVAVGPNPVEAILGPEETALLEAMLRLAADNPAAFRSIVGLLETLMAEEG